MYSFEREANNLVRNQRICEIHVH